MLHLFFFVMTYLTNYPAVAEVAHSGFALGLVNAASICLVGGCVAMRRRRSKALRADEGVSAWNSSAEIGSAGC